MASTRIVKRVVCPVCCNHLTLPREGTVPSTRFDPEYRVESEAWMKSYQSLGGRYGFKQVDGKTLKELAADPEYTDMLEMLYARVVRTKQALEAVLGSSGSGKIL